MSIQPEGESLRRAVRFISERRQGVDPPSTAALVDEAALRFDLSPLETEYLLGFFRNADRSDNADEPDSSSNSESSIES